MNESNIHANSNRHSHASLTLTRIHQAIIVTDLLKNPCAFFREPK
jgi:hypothetical protein